MHAEDSVEFKLRNDCTSGTLNTPCILSEIKQTFIRFYWIKQHSHWLVKGLRII